MVSKTAALFSVTSAFSLFAAPFWYSSVFAGSTPGKPADSSRQEAIEEQSPTVSGQSGAGPSQALVQTSKQGTSRQTPLPAAGENYVNPSQSMPPCSYNRKTNSCKPGFLLIGVEKSGSSTLSKMFESHPQIKAPKKRELLWWTQSSNHGQPSRLVCEPDPQQAPSDKVFEKYLAKFPKVENTLTLRHRSLSADFSPTSFHCWCCPASFQRLMPHVRLAVLLRDPISRAFSRWQERVQLLDSAETMGNTFFNYSAVMLPKLRSCLDKAGASLTEKVACLDGDTVLGPSIYDAPLKLWLQYYSGKKLLVTYNEDFAEKPAAVLQALERHVGLTAHQYSSSLLRSSYNTASALGWDKKGSANKEAADSEDVDPRARKILTEFYLPHMRELKEMADQRKITPLPASWIQIWNL